ncbi:MAG: succinic semialdehyde dehydrogenase [Microbacteriaceae bacterium]|nr:succinic semialdehyde dehydrogenase [Microbacteriaceae bacterium]MDR9443813.1 succinic semialdehyde dehydrogenase [Microbacteriaceae bacterium]
MATKTKQMNSTDLEQAFQTARDAQKSWQERSFADRRELFLKYHDSVNENQEMLMNTLQSETGKSRNHAFEEITGSLAGIRYVANNLRKALKSHSAKPGIPLALKIKVDYSPVGVVGVVTPWNYPLALTMLDVIPALAAGNAVVQKADDKTVKTIIAAKDLAERNGLPKGLWQVVHGDNEVIGNGLIDHCDYFAFTGSTQTGKKVAQRAAARLIGYSMELGGKNPAIVLEKADLEKTSERLLASFIGNSGQLCVATERAYVPKQELQAYTELLGKKIESLKLGSSEVFDHDLGALISTEQITRVSGFLDRARKSGSRVIGGSIEGQIIQPSLVVETDHTSEIASQEVFGPVLALIPYDTVEQAIEMANDTEYGLNASVFGDVSKAEEVAKQIQAGTVNINEGYRASMASLDAPMGGMKQSGVGRRNGIHGIRRFTEPRTIAINRGFVELPSRGAQYNRMAPMMGMISKVMKRF